jgi:2-amino-4-hydroxy-6-hydroxymethyldihydropteridine diphosphokinase
MNHVYLGLGSNLGDREKNILAAVKALGRLEGTKVIKTSSNFETHAEGLGDDAPLFLNAAIELETTLAPADLLEETNAIEIKLGRTQKNSASPRSIDIDLLFYGDQVILEDDLTVPHPLLHERYFVLAPMNEIASNLVHPILGQTIAELYETVA